MRLCSTVVIKSSISNLMASTIMSPINFMQKGVSLRSPCYSPKESIDWGRATKHMAPPHNIASITRFMRHQLRPHRGKPARQQHPYCPGNLDARHRGQPFREPHGRASSSGPAKPPARTEPLDELGRQTTALGLCIFPASDSRILPCLTKPPK